MRRNRTAVLLALAALIYVLDLISKVVVVALLPPDEPVQVPGTLLTLRLIRNPGAAFGLGVGVTALFTVISVVVVAVILRTARRLGSRRWAIALGLLLGGALGNLTDRIFRSPGPFRGHVVDFVEVPGWPIFNCADASIVVAGLMIVVLALRNVPIEGRRRAPRVPAVHRARP